MAKREVTLMGDRIEIYKDFSLNLFNCIYEYYLDKITLSDSEDIRNHYDWCFNKVNNEFKKENINFENNNKLKNYLFSYYNPNFYNNSPFNSKDDIDFEYYNNFWNSIFNTDNMVNNSETTKTLVDLYILFDETINNKKKIEKVLA